MQHGNTALVLPAATMMLFAGKLADFLINSQILSRIWTRRLFNSLGIGLQTVWLLGLAFGVGRSEGSVGESVGGSGNDSVGVTVGDHKMDLSNSRDVKVAVSLIICATGRVYRVTQKRSSNYSTKELFRDTR